MGEGLAKKVQYNMIDVFKEPLINPQAHSLTAYSPLFEPNFLEIRQYSFKNTAQTAKNLLVNPHTMN